MSLELRNKVRERIAKELLGDAYRADRPLEFGGVVSALLEGFPQDHAQYREKVGLYKGLSRAMEILDEEFRKLSGG